MFGWLLIIVYFAIAIRIFTFEFRRFSTSFMYGWAGWGFFIWLIISSLLWPIFVGGYFAILLLVLLLGSLIAMTSAVVKFISNEIR